MDLIIGTGTVTEASRDTMPATGTPGWATDGNPAATIPATDFPAAHYNMLMAEVIQPILDAGLTLDPANWGQLSAAIKALAKQAASGAVVGSPGVLATGDVAGAVLYYSAALAAPAFTYGSTTVGLATTTALTSALGNYLPLAGGNVTGDMDWGSKTAAGTVTHRFWSAGPPTTGDATPDATLTVTGGTPGTANQGTVELSTGTFDQSGSGKVLVPDVVDFTTQGALGARVAEGRYIGSVLAAGSTNVRITDIQEDASGNLIVTDASGNQKTYAEVTQGVYPDGTRWRRAGPYLEMWMTLTFPDSGWTHITNFPVAFSEVPTAEFQGIDEDLVDGHVGIAGPAANYPTETQIQAVSLAVTAGNGSSWSGASSQVIAYVRGLA
ncbi:hypothetical protein [Komagataeibacter xylinus]|uniref:hypothetical protein n=1 Tax=Komagataeibacter xylinus TaxID=28448 RepID=UPI00280B08E9|nr:hypothetical protein [Komagataeibacter xylinus]